MHDDEEKEEKLNIDINTDIFFKDFNKTPRETEYFGRKLQKGEVY